MTRDAGSSNALGIYIGVVQFFFAMTWILYVIYLPTLVVQAGIGKQWVPWILVADQVIFAVSDVVTGFWVDRMRTGLARFGGWILGLTAISCATFLALPFLNAGAGWFLGSVVVWAITSSALRSPPWVLLSRYAATPQVPWLSTLVLFGGGVAAALGPYLGLALKGVDPRVPFVLSTLTLLAAVGGLVVAERRAAKLPPSSQQQAIEKPDLRGVVLFFVALLLMAAGFQIHFALNSAAQYLQFAAPGQLPYLIPVFWIGFNITMLPASRAVRKAGPVKGLAVAAALGALAILASVLAPNLASLTVAQFIAGGCWGAACVAAFTATLGFGRTGREGKMLGTLFAVLATAAFIRMGVYASDLVVAPTFKTALPWVPEIAWALSAALLTFAALNRRRTAIR
jgi:MFS family permease